MTNNEYQQLVVLLLQHGVLASREEAEALAIKAARGAAVPPPVKAAIREWLDWEKQRHIEQELEEYFVGSGEQECLVASGEEALCELDMYAAWCEANPVSPEVQLFLAKQKQEGALIDPETAEVCWEYGNTLDPYGVYDLPEQFTQIGRQVLMPGVQVATSGCHTWTCPPKPFAGCARKANQANRTAYSFACGGAQHRRRMENAIMLGGLPIRRWPAQLTLDQHCYDCDGETAIEKVTIARTTPTRRLGPRKGRGVLT